MSANDIILKIHLFAWIGVLVAAAGCSTTPSTKPGDERLIGTWKSNREETVAKILERDPKWKSAQPERIEKLRQLFGHLTIRYGEKSVETHYLGETEKLGYKVLERGPDFVVIQIIGGDEDGKEERLRFVEDDHSYWVHSSMMPTIEERFDKIPGEASGVGKGK
jgi:hypothetical protein